MKQTAAERTGANVRAEMARRGMTQAGMGAALGLSQPSIADRLRGRIAFDVNELETAAAVLRVDVAVLIGDPAPASTS